MSTSEISMIKRLNSKLKVLKTCQIFTNVKQLNKRKGKDEYVCGERILKTEIIDDYILLLNLQNGKTLSLIINYQGKTEKDLCFSAGISKHEKIYGDWVTYYTSSDKINSLPMNFHDFSDRLRVLCQKITKGEVNKENIVNIFSEIMGVDREAHEQGVEMRKQNIADRLVVLSEKQKENEKRKKTLIVKINKTEKALFEENDYDSLSKKKEDLQFQLSKIINEMSKVRQVVNVATKKESAELSKVNRELQIFASEVSDLENTLRKLTK